MQDRRTSIILGALLVVAGLVFLAQNLELLGSMENLIWVVLFGLGGLAFLYVFAANREQWWAIIPGFTLLGLAALIGFGESLGALGGAFFLGAIGLAFWVIYALRRDFWWAIIPAGALTKSRDAARRSPWMAWWSAASSSWAWRPPSRWFTCCRTRKGARNGR